MKLRLFVTLMMLMALPAQADIRVLFANRAIAYGIDAPVGWLGGIYGTGAPLAEQSRVQGQWFRAQLYAALEDPYEWIGPVGEPVSFRTAGLAGSVQPHEVVIPTPGRTGQITAQVWMVAWCRIYGDSFDQVQAMSIGGAGQSASVRVSGFTPDVPIVPAPALVGLQPFVIPGPPGPVPLPPTVPAALLPVVVGNGRLGYRFTGLRSGWELTIEASTNLTHWLPYQRPWLPRGQTEFIFEATADGPAQFFRGWQH